jgi:hypothetical protein
MGGEAGAPLCSTEAVRPASYVRAHETSTRWVASRYGVAMNVQELAEDLVAAAAKVVDAAWAEHFRSMVDAGEHDIALVSVIEDVPTAVAPDAVDAVEQHYRGSGHYVELEALTAVARYRAHAARS